MASPKNDGVTATIKQTPGAIGYIEYGFANMAKLPMATRENKGGKFIKPTLVSGQATLATAKLPDDLCVWVSDPESADAYPIVTYTWRVFYKKYDNPQMADAIRKVVKYCLTEGQKVSGEMGYVPLPDGVVQAVAKAADNIQ